MTTINRKKIMVQAWQMARKGAAQFGGKAKTYLASALAICWKEEKALALKEEEPKTVWRLGLGSQFVLPGSPMSASGAKKGQLILPGLMA